MIATLVSPRRASVALVVAACVAATSGCSAPKHAATSTAAFVPAQREREIRDRDVEFYRARAERDPTGATDLAHLAALYLQRSRDTGDPRDAQRAETTARRSIHNRGAHNVAASQVLASSLLAQHRFVDALAVAKRVRDSDPTSGPLRAAVAEIEMELGQYDSAKATFASLDDSKSNLAVAPRLARWSEIRGHNGRGSPSYAGCIGHRAARAAAAARAACLVLPRGRHRAPRRALLGRRLGISGWSRCQSGRLSRARRSRPSRFGPTPVARRDSIWRAGRRVQSRSRDIGNLDAYAATGDSARATDFARALDVAVSKQPGAYHRAWSLFLLDHDRHVAMVARKIRQELETRRDIYGYDLVSAWSLHKQGRDEEASRAMAMALSQWHQGSGSRVSRRRDRARIGAMSTLATFIQLGFRHIVDVGAMDHIPFLLALAAIYRQRDARNALRGDHRVHGRPFDVMLAVTGVLDLHRR